MSVRKLVVIKTLVTVLLLMALLITPVWMNTLLGINIRASGELIIFYLVASFTAIAVMCRINRAIELRKQKSMTIALMSCDTLSFAVTLNVLFNLLPVAWGWVVVLLWFSLAVGSFYYTWFDRVMFDVPEAA